MAAPAIETILSQIRNLEHAAYRAAAAACQTARLHVGTAERRWERTEREQIERRELGLRAGQIETLRRKLARIEARLHAAVAPCASCGEDAPAGATICPECGADPAAKTAACSNCEGTAEYERQTGRAPWLTVTEPCRHCTDGQVEAPFLLERVRALGEPWAMEAAGGPR